MKNFFLSTLLVIGFSGLVHGQNYTSLGNGSWTTPGTWNNTSGWGPGTPPINGDHGSGTITMQHEISINAAYALGSATLNVGGGHTLTVNGNMVVDGGATVNVYGTIHITGSLTLNSTFIVHPGGNVIVDGSVQVNSSQYLIIGTTAPAAPPHARMVIRQNLNSSGSGDVRIRQNGWLAVFGDYNANGDGALLTIDDGGQMYVNGNTTFNGGGNHLTNNNNSAPWGFYSDNDPTYVGGGSNTNGAAGGNAVQNTTTLETENPDFYNWIAGVSGSTLPVTLIFFEAKEITSEGVALIWATASELNFDHFQLQRSVDGKSFETIATIEGHGTSNERHDYSYIDRAPVSGLSYYRLVSIDYDLYTETFPVVPVRVESEKEVIMYPVPVTNGQINFRLNFAPESDVMIVVSDMSGNQLVSDSITAGETTMAMNLNLTPGVYVVKVHSEEISKIERVLVGSR